MADTPEVRQAYYEKEQIRTLRLKLATLRADLRENTNPKMELWYEARINELVVVLFERTVRTYWYEVLRWPSSEGFFMPKINAQKTHTKDLTRHPIPVQLFLFTRRLCENWKTKGFDSWCGY